MCWWRLTRPWRAGTRSGGTDMADVDPRELARARGRYHASRRRRYPTACANCGGQFPGLSWQRYCSAACRKRANQLLARERGYQPPKRPARPRADRLPKVRPCVNCRRVLRIAARGRCMACAYYVRRYGVDRPAEGFWHVQRVCRTCGGPTRPHQRAHGECHACRAYRCRWGVARPSSLWLDPGPWLRDARGRFLPQRRPSATEVPT
jgi:hypothetical protein